MESVVHRRKKSADPNFDVTEGGGHTTEGTMVCCILSKGLVSLTIMSGRWGKLSALSRYKGGMRSTAIRAGGPSNVSVGMMDLWLEMEKSGLTLLANRRK